jgi:hypothetical protein
MEVMMQLHLGGFNLLEILNESIFTLLPKNEGSSHLRDFRPINLIHGAAKIFAKVLAVRLSPLLPEIIAQAQSAFVSTRSIHENFKFVRGAAQQLHQRKTKAILMKIDISKASNTLSWEFLLEVLRRRGFGERWITWICGLLRTASTSILLNGVLGEPFMMGSGVRQGDPISPAMFIIAMGTLHAMMEWAK